MSEPTGHTAPRGWSLVRRATVSCVLLVLGTSLALTATFNWQAYRGAVRVQLSDAAKYVETLSKLAAAPQAANDVASLKLLMQSALADDGLVYAAVLDRRGEVVCGGTNRAGYHPGKSWDQLVRDQNTTERGWVGVDRQGSDLCVASGIWPRDQGSAAQGPVGFIYLEYNLADVGEEHEAVALASGITTLMIVAVACVVTPIRVRRLLQPIDTLALQTAALAAGRRDVRVDEKAPGEFGDLARSFNNMVDQLATSSASIEQTVAERTAELEQRQSELEMEIRNRERIEAELREAKEDAEAASRAKSEFLANMSHELRTPLNGVIGMSELLMATNLTGKQEHFARSCMRSADALLALINDILDLSSVEAGTLKLECADFDVWETIENVADVQVQMAADKHLKFTCTIDAAVPRFARGDAHRFWQVLANLANNAVKFTEQGEITVHATSVTSDGDGETIRVEVQDTGIGIAPEQQQRLFKAFSQVDGSMTRRYGGSGLGLRIAQQIVELMGGEIGVKSELGEGSTFWFTVRLDRARTADEREHNLCLLFPHLSRLHVLIVDDNVLNREILTGQLAGWGIQADSAVDGPSALTALRRAEAADQPYHLAILDMQMPEMDGLQLGRIIKADPAIQQTVLIMLTSVGDDGVRLQALDIGFHAAMAKPVRQSALYEAVVKAANLIVESMPAANGP
ncbi:MAG TPA: ATP-binding protein, partial [Phycisphaerae bacterium]|nr:ATP-binding protein [Phycisphaerae bacterium]